MVVAVLAGTRTSVSKGLTATTVMEGLVELTLMDFFTKSSGVKEGPGRPALPMLPGALPTATS